MGQKTSRFPLKENSSRLQNQSQIKYAAPPDPRHQWYSGSEGSIRQQRGQHIYEQQKIYAGPPDPRYYNNEPHVRYRQQGGHSYEQQGFGQEYQVASNHDQPQGKHLKSKKKSEKKKKKDIKPKKSKHTPVSERSDSKKQKPKRIDEVHTTKQDHMGSGTNMGHQKDRSHDRASANASGTIYPSEHNNLDYHEGSRALQRDGPSAPFSTSFSGNRKEDLEKELKQTKELLSKKEEEIHSIRERLSRTNEELHGVRQELENTRREADEKIRKYEEDLERKTEKIKHLEAEKNDLLNRLSSEAAARMTYNNPNITDLSDQDRPTKITERYVELYDNQWTDAFQNLQTSYQLSDTKAIEVLLDVLYISFDVCRKIREQRDTLVRNLAEYVGEAGGDVIISEVMTTLKGAKKKNIAKMHKDYAKKVQEVLETKYSKELQYIGPYVNECVELCLLMNIHDPALELRGVVSVENTVFDMAVFRPYTKSGSRIEHMVWPALYLYNNGPLLCRGVAQGMRDSSEGHKSTIINVHTSKEEH